MKIRNQILGLPENKYIFVTAAILFYVIIFILPSACYPNFDSNERAVSAMQSEGYSDVKVLKKSTFFTWIDGCANSEQVVFYMEAKNIKNQTVSPIVYCGIIKGCTIRH